MPINNSVVTQPFFTIITATYNAVDVLPRLLKSLATQTCQDFSLVIQDGCSVDNTLLIIEEWRDRLPAVFVQSASDNGIFDAWNKALECQGDNLGSWVIFLGADDLLAGPEVLATVKAMAEMPDTICFLAGSIIQCRSDGSEERRISPCPDVDMVSLYKAMPLANPGTFYRKTLFDKRREESRFNTSFAIAGDYDFVARTWSNVPVAYNLNMIVAHMFIGGVSTSMCGRLQNLKESCRVGMRYAPAWRVWGHMIRTGMLDLLYILCLKFPIFNPLRQWARAWFRRCQVRGFNEHRH